MLLWKRLPGSVSVLLMMLLALGDQKKRRAKKDEETTHADCEEPKAKAKAASSKPKEKEAPSSKRKTSPKCKAAPKTAPKPKEKANRSKGSKKAVETPPATKAKEDDLEVHLDPADVKKLEAKEKRRQRAAGAANLLKKEQRTHQDMLGDLEMPTSLGDRISFTLADPEKKVLLSESSWQLRVSMSLKFGSTLRLGHLHAANLRYGLHVFISHHNTYSMHTVY